MEVQEKLKVGQLQKTRSEIIYEKKEEIVEILDSNLEEFTETFDDLDRYETKKIAIKNTVIALISLSILLYVKFFDLGKIQGTFVDTIIVFLVSIIFTYSLLGVTYRVFAYFIKEKKKSIPKYLFTKNEINIKLTLGLYIVFFALSYFLPEVTNNLFNNSSIELNIVNFFKKFINSTLLILLSFYTLKLLKDFMLQAVEYRIHFKFYEKRIQENEQIVTFLQELNNIAGNKIDPSLKKWSNHIYECLISKTLSRTLHESDFIRYFGAEQGEKIFDLFDVNFDGTVSKEEFTTRYVSLFEERKNLKKALTKNDGTMAKLEKVIFVTMAPVLFYAIYVAISDRKSFLNNFGFIGSGLISISFAFSSVISELFTCIVFIYFIRPFDVGDAIFVDNKLLKVKSLGLLSSNFYEDTVLHSISNLTIKGMDIINYRELGFKTVKIIKKFDYETCFGKISLLHKRIQKFLKLNRNLYTNRYHIYQFQIEKNIIEMAFEINIICRFQEIKTMYKRQDKFTVFLHDLSEELGFTPRHHF